MEIKKSNYNVVFDLVENVTEAESMKNYFDYHIIGNSIYSICVETNFGNKDLEKLLVEEFIPTAELLILKNPNFRKGCKFSYNSSTEIDNSEN